MFPQSKEITVFHQILLTCHAIETLDHSKSLFITDNDNIGIMLFYQTDRSGMIRLHMIYY